MSPGWGVRTTRAAVFAAVCVLLAALGHILMSGTPVPWWALGAATAATGSAAWCLADRERGLFPVSAAVVTVQTALHLWFSYAQELTPATVSLGGGTGDGTSAAGPAHHMAHMGHAMHSMTATGSAPQPMPGGEHATAGMSSTGMLAAHLLAALLCGLWLAYGERAAFRILRAVAARLAAPLRLLLALPAPRPRLRVRRSHTTRAPRRLLLVHTLTSRGPPAGTAVPGARRTLRTLRAL
ncbi:hypothetical protein N4P33_33405 [Streptomyces sp. 15-116A]|uniref:hypothetical protein n=1 Tax=Streptomyces sp. 15-116A TaxID=2259035 RepID=UPI0021B1B21C|nr:hypothetical protein [Streptomyces sp. 15-116A]MCT7357002.1 hypothetical protein [Streptomyces sp. 15-116A]